MKSLAVILLLALICNGCGTIACHDGGQGTNSPKSGLYRGVRHDYHEITSASGEQEMAVPFYLIDMPLSLACDTLFLPIDIILLMVSE